MACLTQSLGYPLRVIRLCLTHAHPDQIGGAQAICAATGCHVLAHAAHRTWIEDVAQQVWERPVPGFHQLVGGSVPVDVTLAPQI
jgi:hydroxyacylglutathione hydrolase